MSDPTKLLDACVEYRAMVDKLEAENAELRVQVEELDAKWKMAEAHCFDQVGKIGELKRENAALRAALVEFRDACFDAFFLPAPNVKPYYSLVKKHATFLPSPKPKKEAGK